MVVAVVVVVVVVVVAVVVVLPARWIHCRARSESR